MRSNSDQLPLPNFLRGEPRSGLKSYTGRNVLWDEVLVLDALHQPKDEAAKWQYSLSRMTVRQMAVKLDDRLVYEQAYTGLRPVQQANWMWFWQKGILPEDPEK